ncbi:MAG: hypothetical protein U0575_15810 [Phycisphaerales bacterium]
MRALAYLWALPNTLLGLCVFAAAFPFGAHATWRDGALEVHGRAIGAVLRRLPVRGGAAALTLGHVILAGTRGAHDLARAHERVHVRQYERWGPSFLPAYAASSLVAALRGGDPYRDNRFEREAYGDPRAATPSRGMPGRPRRGEQNAAPSTPPKPETARPDDVPPFPGRRTSR